MEDTLDAIIIGAGLSGLQSALDLHKNGRSFTILEARDRVGGKLNSVQRPDGKGIQELGATWLNNTHQSLVWSYCEKFGLTPVVQNIKGSVASEDADGNCHFFPFGELPKFGQLDTDNIARTRDIIEAASLDSQTFQQPKRGELDNKTLEQWCRDFGAGTRALQTVRLWCRGTLGQDPSEVSALTFLEIARGALGVVNLRYDGKDGAQHLRIQEGTLSIPTGMLKLLPEDVIKLNSPVKSVVQSSKDSYIVTTTHGRPFKARKVIVSIPSPAYKTITFEPRLSPEKELYTLTARYGCYIKFICLFKTPFWRRQGACGLAQSFRGPINHCRDTSVDGQENFALTCFICSAPGRKWLRLNDEAGLEAVLRQISSLFGTAYDAVKAEFLGSLKSEWMQDPWAGWGCPFAATPPSTIGDSEDGQISSEKNGGIYFVGTELSDEWRGYMEGALRSGRRGAAQALADLNAEEAKL